MDKNSIFGIIIAFGAIFLGQYLEGGSYATLANLPAFVIVVGCTFGIILLETPKSELKNTIRITKWIFTAPVFEFNKSIEKIVRFANDARMRGILSLEEELDSEHDLFLKKGLKLVIDGKDDMYISHTMEIELANLEEKDLSAAHVYESMGGYAPTIGIVGALIGLIHVLGNITAPELLAKGVAIAFIATMYGVVLANLLFIPISNKLKKIIAKRASYHEMLINGLCLISTNENPSIIQNHLEGYIQDED